MWVELFYPPSVFTVVHRVNGITQAVSPTILFSGFAFFSSYSSTASPPRWLWDCSSTPYLKFRLTSPKDSTIARLSQSDHHLFCYIPAILTTLIVFRVVLLLIRIILIRPCVNFMLFRSVRTPCIQSLMLGYASFFDCKQDRQWISSILKKIPTSYCNSLTSFVLSFSI